MIGSTLFGIGRTTTVTESELDSDAITAELADVQECAGDPFEFATAIVYENELAMMKLDAAIMCCEYAYLKENGEEMVYEAGAMKNFFAGAKKFISECWEKIKAFFKKIFAWLADAVKYDKKFVEKYKKDCEEAGTVTVEVKGYDYKGLANVSTALLKLANEATSFNGTNVSEDASIEDWQNEIVKEVVKAINSSVNNADYSSFKEKLKDAIKGDEVKGSVNCPAQLKNVEDFKKDKADLEKTYKQTKAVIESAKKQVEASEKYILKTTDKKEGQEAAKGAHATVSCIKTLLSMATAVDHCAASAIKARRAQAKRFIVAALAEYKKNNSANDSTAGSTANESSIYDDIFDSILG